MLLDTLYDFRYVLVPSLQIYIELYIFVIHLKINNQMAVK